MKIFASGFLLEKKTDVECSISDQKTTFTFNGRKNKVQEKWLRRLLQLNKPVGGTYFPPVNSALNVYNVLENYYFDRLLSIECDGEIEEMPSAEGRVY